MDVTITWAAASDPSVSWNLYLRTGASFSYIASFAPETRSTVLHNQSAGLMEVGVSRVENETIDGIAYQVEGAPTVVAKILQTPVTLPPGPTIG
jgi:hypothetical protein